MLARISMPATRASSTPPAAAAAIVMAIPGWPARCKAQTEAVPIDATTPAMAVKP